MALTIDSPTPSQSEPPPLLADYYLDSKRSKGTSEPTALLKPTLPPQLGVRCEEDPLGLSITETASSQLGHLTWVIVNDAPQAWPARLEVSGAAGKMLQKYQVTSEHRDQSSLRIEPLNKVRLTKGAANVADVLPPMSLTIYSAYDPGHAERGVVAE